MLLFDREKSEKEGQTDEYGLHDKSIDQARTESKPSTPPAVRPFKPAIQTLSSIGDAAAGVAAAGSAVMISSTAAAWLVVTPDHRLAAAGALSRKPSMPLLVRDGTRSPLTLEL